MTRHAAHLSWKLDSSSFALLLLTSSSLPLCRKSKMRLLVPLVCLGIVVALTSGCTPSVPKPPPLATVKGTIQLDGKPMKSGDVEFEAIAQPPKTMKIEDGAFSGEVFTGKNTVRVHMYKEGPPASTDPEKKPMKMEAIPAQYNTKSSLSYDVPEGGASDLKFNVTSK
jgi:hypothetical protein